MNFRNNVAAYYALGRDRFSWVKETSPLHKNQAQHSATIETKFDSTVSADEFIRVIGSYRIAV